MKIRLERDGKKHPDEFKQKVIVDKFGEILTTKHDIAVKFVAKRMKTNKREEERKIAIKIIKKWR